jgi:hypothetical protein
MGSFTGRTVRNLYSLFSLMERCRKLKKLPNGSFFSYPARFSLFPGGEVVEP